MRCDSPTDRIGNTPLVRLQMPSLPHAELYAKLEGTNPTGSVKDRGACQVVTSLLKSGRIGRDTVLIESTSGNFGIALAHVCQRLGLRFVCVIDPNITRINEMLIHALGAEVIKVERPDPRGGYLATRIATVERFVAATPNAYWVNQYGNPLLAEAYAETLGRELFDELPDLDLLFVGVGSGGTIAGLTIQNQRRGGRTTIVPVDAEGSVIFGGPQKPRFIPGIGSSMVPLHFQRFPVGPPAIVREADAARACGELLTQHGLFVGGSSGSVFHAARQHLAAHPGARITAAMIFADTGDRYADTVFDHAWCRRLTAN